MRESPNFICPQCFASHRRGFVDGVCVFRCLRCGYQGHGFHADLEIDREVYSDFLEANKHLRSVGLPEIPLGRDPLSGEAP